MSSGQQPLEVSPGQPPPHVLPTEPPLHVFSCQHPLLVFYGWAPPNVSSCEPALLQPHWPGICKLAEPRHPGAPIWSNQPPENQEKKILRVHC